MSLPPPTKLDAADGQSCAPPMFLVMAQNEHVNSLNCTVLYTALTKEHVPAELHLFPTGGHGYGLRVTSEPVTRWHELAAVWLAKFSRP